jgi:iron complex transport system ATP-binding protein
VVHDLTLAARFADRVIVMDRGRLIADAPATEALSAQRIAETFRVEAVIVDTGDGGGAIPIARRPL